MKKESATNNQLHNLLNNDVYTEVIRGGKYEKEFDLILKKYNGDLYHTALAAFSMGAGVQEIRRRGALCHG